MKLSEAIRVGAKIRPQAFGGLYEIRESTERVGWFRKRVKREKRSCVWGAAIEAAECVSRKIREGEPGGGVPVRGSGAKPGDEVEVVSVPDNWRAHLASKFPLFDRPVEKTRAEQIEKRWRDFHAKWPVIYRLFTQYAFEKIHAGFGHYSPDATMHRARWELPRPIAVNNDFVTLYADLFSADYPQHGDFFPKRKRTSEDRPAYATDIEITDNGPRQPNAAADERMAHVAHLNSPNFHRP